jgi:hypothetical protein
MSAADIGGEGAGRQADGKQTLSLAELQAIVNVPTGGSVRVHDPVWLTRFRLHHRQTAHYRAGPLFLAGDAAHIHSPVGGQGMNTGIQDAWNLGWKLALVVKGAARADLLDSYDAERWPVGRFLLRYTDRAFSSFARVVSSGGMAAWVRRVIAPLVLPAVLESQRLRASAFRFVSQLGIRYRESPAVTEGTPPLGAGPRAGDRLPDVEFRREGRSVWLQQEVIGPGLALLLCGRADDWSAGHVERLRAAYPALLSVYFLDRVVRQTDANTLTDERGGALETLGVREAAQYLVRPDGYVAFRCAGRALDGLERYLAAWYTPAASHQTKD